MKWGPFVMGKAAIWFAKVEMLAMVVNALLACKIFKRPLFKVFYKTRGRETNRLKAPCRRSPLRLRAQRDQ